jgi:hypothetical protein
MQRRAAAVSAALFVLVAAGGYAFVGLAEEPGIEVEADHELGPSDSVTLAGTQYTATSVDVAGGQATLQWTNESDRYTATLGNNSTVPASSVAWEGQTNRHSATLANGSVVAYNESDYRVVVAAGEAPDTFLLNDTASNASESHAQGDTLIYDANRTTVVSVTSEAVTLAWGDPYRVLVENASDPAEFTLLEQINATRLVAQDPDAETLLTDDDGTRFVRFTDGSTERLAEYLHEPERRTFAEGGTLTYQGNETTPATVGSEEVVLEWFGTKTNTVRALQGSNVTVGGETYLAHFPEGASAFMLTQDFQGYEDSQDRIDYYHERISGIWAATIISGLAAVLLIGLSYLPSRY